MENKLNYEQFVYRQTRKTIFNNQSSFANSQTKKTFMSNSKDYKNSSSTSHKSNEN